MITKNPVWKVNPLPQVQHYVNSVAISADGTRVVGGTYFFQYGASANHRPTSAPSMTVGTFAWDNKGNPLWNHQFKATEGVYWVALSRDCSWAASCGLVSSNLGFIYAYNASSGANQLLASPPVRVNMVALSGDGTYLVAGADAVYFFTRSGNNWTAAPPVNVGANDDVVSVGISSDGAWIVAGTYHGSVLLIPNNNGTLGTPLVWQLNNGAVDWVSMAANGSAFAAGGTETSVYFFNTDGFQNSQKPAWVGALTGCKGSCRCVAVSDDASFVSAVASSASTKGGNVVLFANNGASGKIMWSQSLLHSPNSTSIDSNGQYVTAADGHPDGTPGAFYLFSASGTPIWSCPTSNMSWPMQIAASDGGITAGSDDGNIYYFSVP